MSCQRRAVSLRHPGEGLDPGDSSALDTGFHRYDARRAESVIRTRSSAGTGIMNERSQTMPLNMERQLREYIAPVVLLTLAASGGHAAARAESAAYPSRPVRAIVPFPAGSGTDLLARFIGSRLTERVGQQIVIDNRP